MLTVELGKTSFKSRASTVKRKNTTPETALSLEKICQKTSIGFANFYLNDCV